MDKKAIKRMYADKKAYIENDLAAALRVMPDFDGIKYAVDTIKNEEFVKWTETLGFVYFVNVTGKDKSEIFRDVCRLVLQYRTADRIMERSKLREVNRLFV